jgi:hypothetical protein
MRVLQSAISPAHHLTIHLVIKLLLLFHLRVSRWVMPICFLAGILSYLESTNLNFAALQLNGGLGFAPQVTTVTCGFSHGCGHGSTAVLVLIRELQPSD